MSTRWHVPAESVRIPHIRDFCQLSSRFFLKRQILRKTRLLILSFYVEPINDRRNECAFIASGGNER